MPEGEVADASAILCTEGSRKQFRISHRRIKEGEGGEKAKAIETAGGWLPGDGIHLIVVAVRG